MSEPTFYRVYWRRLKRLARQPITWGCVSWLILMGLIGNYFFFVGPAWVTVILLLFFMVSVGALGWAIGSNGVDGAFGDLLHRAVDSLPEGRLILARDGSTIYANKAFRRLLPCPPDQVNIHAVLPILHDDWSRQELKRVIGNARIGVSDYAEVSLRGMDDMAEWRRIAAYPLERPKGFSLWTVRDVTVRREIQTAQQQEFRQNYDFLDNLPIGFFSTDRTGRFRFVNQTLGDWLGMAPELMRASGLGLTDFIETMPEGNDGAMKLRGADGKPFGVHIRQSELYDGKGQFVHNRCVVLRDGIEHGVSAAPRPAASAKASLGHDPRVRWLFNEAPIGIVTLDLDRNVLDCNRALLKLLGRHRDAIVGRPLFDQIKQDYHEDANRQLSKVMMGVMPAVRFDVQMATARGRVLTLNAFAGHTENEAGEINGLVLHFIDATEQRDLEQQFTQAQKMQAIGQLAGGVAHDFNNLLTAIIGFCDMLLIRHPENDPSWEDLNQISQNANRAANLVRQLLAFSRRQTLRPEVLDVTDLLSELSNLLRRLMGDNTVLHLKHGRDLHKVRVDPGQFEQVIVNLAVNARDAIEGKGGDVTIRSSNVRADQPIEQGHDIMPAGEYVCIDVSDTGCGISKENLAKIFEPFFTTKDTGKGTGLGLSTVYGIVRQTEGYVFVDSELGVGTTFSVYLPIVDEETAAKVESRQPDLFDHADLTGTATVLLVEDEDPVRLFGSRALTAKGYKVLEAANGEEGWNMVQKHHEEIDLIITDVVMPGMKGPEMIELVRQRLPEVKVIFMSGYAEDVIPEGIENDPSIHFLPKPFKLKDLAFKVKEVLGEI